MAEQKKPELTSSKTEITKKPEDPKPFDAKGHLPETNVPNKDAPGVHRGQIEDKGASVAKSEPPKTQTPDYHVARSAIPTGSDIPNPTIPVRKEDIEETKVPEEKKPENMARAQSQSEAAKVKKKTMKMDLGKTEEDTVFNRPNDLLGQPVHRTLSGIDDGSIPGSRTGNPLEIPAEDFIGDKVHDIHDDGSSTLKVMNKDKSRADTVYEENDSESNTAQKMKVSLRFPSINPQVAQRRLSVKVGDNEPWQRVYPPDVPNVEILVTPDVLVHVELAHADSQGRESHPYVLNFYSNHKVTPRPLEPSPIGVELMEILSVKE